MNEAWRRTALGALLGLATLLALTRVGMLGYRHVRSQMGRVDQKSGQVRLAERRVGRLRAIEAAGPATRERLVAIAPALLSGAPSSAEADLRARVLQLADSCSVRIVDAQALADSDSIGYLAAARIGLTMEADTRGLSGMLEALATGVPYTLMDSISITPKDPYGDRRRPEVLSIRLVASGRYLRREPQ